MVQRQSWRYPSFQHYFRFHEAPSPSRFVGINTLTFIVGNVDIMLLLYVLEVMEVSQDQRQTFPMSRTCEYIC